MLWSKSKKLYSMGRIRRFYIACESFKIKVHENSTPLATTHVNDFEYHFPDVDLSPTLFSNSGSWTLYGVFFCVCYFFLVLCWVYLASSCLCLLRGRLDLEHIPTWTDLLGACSSLIWSYQNTNLENDYYNASGFSSFLHIFFQDVCSDLLTPLFFLRFFSITIFFWLFS